jgi:MoaD family protein
MMRIELEIAFSFKRELAEGYRALELPEGANVAEGLRHLAYRYPSARDRLFDREGNLHRHINVLVNGINVTLRDEFGTILREGDRLTILPPVGGG